MTAEFLQSTSSINRQNLAEITTGSKEKIQNDDKRITYIGKLTCDIS